MCPSLVIYPDRSFIFEVEQGLAFYRHLLDGELMVLPNCGHNTYEERPAEYLQAILDFHARLRNPSSRRKARVSCAA
jgi:pimeloyl-ACP methyl ester carboxylesterase